MGTRDLRMQLEVNLINERIFDIHVQSREKE